ncbi:hypothetical protein AAOE16_08905 [Ekhidna sp. MALMAid0563]|uniref:hypothetical protein n=1 Tax=Ekhidna sp. MALMAid0563 TaxID=3143937 RepID=UPI0032DF85AE
MKKHILLLVFVIPMISNSQIIYDFSKRTKLDIKELKSQVQPVKNGNFLIFKVENVNTFRYKVELEGNNIDYVTPIPSELQTLFRLPKEEITQEVQVAEDAAAKTKAQIPRMQGVLEDVQEEAGAPGVAAGRLNDLQDLEKTIEELLAKCTQYGVLMQKMADIKFSRMLLINISKQKWDKHQDLVAELPAPKSESTMKRDYLEFVKYYYEVEDLYDKAKEMAEDLGVGAAIVSSATERIEDAYHQVENDQYLKLIEDVITLQRALENKSYFEVVSPPIQMDGDFVEFTVNITPTRVNDLLPYEQATEFQMQIPGKGGWRADFSVGPTISMGSGARNHSFFLEKQVNTTMVGSDDIPTEIDSVGVLRKTVESDAVRPGVAAMIHAYPRTGKGLNVGWMLGVGAGFQSTDDLNFSLYSGPTFVVGKREKFMFSLGWSFHNVDRLKEEYRVGEGYPADEIDTNNLTQKYFKSSFFLSLSYAIGSRTIIN